MAQLITSRVKVVFARESFFRGAVANEQEFSCSAGYKWIWVAQFLLLLWISRVVQPSIRIDLCYTTPRILMPQYTGNWIRHVSANSSLQPTEKSHNIEIGFGEGKQQHWTGYRQSEDIFQVEFERGIFSVFFFMLVGTKKKHSVCVGPLLPNVSLFNLFIMDD